MKQVMKNDLQGMSVIQVIDHLIKQVDELRARVMVLEMFVQDAAPEFQPGFPDKPITDIQP